MEAAVALGRDCEEGGSALVRFERISAVDVVCLIKHGKDLER